MKNTTKKTAANTPGLLKNYVAALCFLIAATLSGKADTITDALRIKIANSSYSDETVIRFVDGATTDFDGSYDAWKMFSFNAAVPNIFTKTCLGDELAISALPTFTASVTADVFLKIGTAGTFTLSAEELGVFSPDVKIIMKDLSTNQLYDLRSANTYTFSFPVIALTAPARFQVFFSYPASTQISGTSCSVCADGAVVVTKSGETNWQYQVKDASGNNVATGIAPTCTQNITGLASGSYTVSISGNFSYTEKKTFLIGTTPVLLGATFIAFTATPLEESVNLSWSTGMESNSSFFSVERSEDGINYESISQVAAAGNSSIERTYSASDADPYGNTTYYRIKLTDLNGDISFSKIITAPVKATASFSAFPVPAREVLNLSINGNKNSEVIITINDLAGNEVMNTRTIPAADRDNMTLEIASKLSPGVYMISATGKNKTVSQKIIIN